MTEDKKHFPREARNWQEAKEFFCNTYTEREWQRLYHCEWPPEERVAEPFAPHHIIDLLERECPELLK